MRNTRINAQNEMIQIMALSIPRDLLRISEIQCSFPWADETTDIHNREHFVLVLRHVDEKLPTSNTFDHTKWIQLTLTLLQRLLKTVFFECVIVVVCVLMELAIFPDCKNGVS